MTRETKVGLVVAGSFLCLVGIVVASKWRRGDAPTDAEEQSVQQVAAAKPSPKSAAPDAKKDGAAKDDKGPSLPSLPVFPKTDEKKNDKPGDVLDVSKLPPLVMPPPTKDNETLKKELEQALARNKSDKEPGAIKIEPLPMPGALPTFPQLDPKEPAVGDVKITLPDALKKPEGTPAVTEFPALKPPAAEEKKAVVIAPPDLNKPGGATDQAIPPLNTKDPIPAFPSIGKPAAQEPGIAIIPPQKEAAKDPPVTLRPPNSIPRIGGDDLPSTPLISPNAGGGNKALLPVVKDVSSDFYECRPGETSLALVSLKLYGSDKYAEALLAYNRRHSSGIKNGEVFLFDRPTLAAGQQVLHPPVNILERDYGGLIRIGGAASVPTIPSVPPVKIATPSNPGVTPASTLPTVGSGRRYEVQNPAGESILDIAERALGDRAQWHRIWRINQQYQPQFRIPVGTKLELPAN